MALFNTLNEPKRELMETYVGLVFYLALIGSISFITYELHPIFPWEPNIWLPWQYFCEGLFVIICGLFIWSFLILVHETGDGLCNILERASIQMRPEHRYNRWQPREKFWR